MASEAFSLIDTFVYEQLWKMIRKRHRKKSSEWLANHYWTHGKRRWMFSIKGQNKKGPCIYQVIRLSSLGIKRYIKIKADANPYDPKYGYYFWRRRNQKETRLLPALSAREYRNCKSAWGETAGASHKVVLY